LDEGDEECMLHVVPVLEALQELVLREVAAGKQDVLQQLETTIVVLRLVQGEGPINRVEDFLRTVEGFNLLVPV